MSQVEIDYIGEGSSDDALARALISAAGGKPGKSYRRPLSGSGKSSLDGRLPGLNAGTVFGNALLALRDLDSDYPCPSALVTATLANRHPKMLLRVCVRSAESWLMADHVAFGQFCGIAPEAIPPQPENISDLKQTLLHWAETGSATRLKRHVTNGRRRGLRNWQILGEWNARFIETDWNPRRAAQSGRAPSLERALKRIEERCR
jgi:hypothetical protein